MSLLDALIGTPWWAIETSIRLVLSLIGLVFVIPLAIVRLVSEGKRSVMSLAGLYQTCAMVPFFGPMLFSSLIGVVAPYSAGIGAYMLAVERSGVCIASIRERPWLKNPFNSIHALALANLGELVTGLAVMTLLEKRRNTSAIVTGINTTYSKKARGTITGYANVTLEVPEDTPGDYHQSVVGELKNAKGEVVATTTVQWTFRVKAKKAKKE